MIKVIHVVLDDLHWPNLSCQVGESIHQVQYDIAASQFEVHVNNALHKALRQMIHERKNPPKKSDSDWPEWRPLAAERLTLEEMKKLEPVDVPPKRRRKAKGVKYGD